MKSNAVVWTVVVSVEKDNQVTVETLVTDVKDDRNAIPQAKMRNQGPGYDWENAEVRKHGRRRSHGQR